MMNAISRSASWWPSVKAFLERMLERWMVSTLWLESDTTLCAEARRAALAISNDHEPFEWHI
jgi:hypothetical protein